MNASCNWVDLLQVSSVQFLWYGQAFAVQKMANRASLRITMLVGRSWIIGRGPPPTAL